MLEMITSPAFSFYLENDDVINQGYDLHFPSIAFEVDLVCLESYSSLHSLQHSSVVNLILHRPSRVFQSPSIISKILYLGI